MLVPVVVSQVFRPPVFSISKHGFYVFVAVSCNGGASPQCCLCVCVCVCVSVSPPGDGGCDGDHVAHELDNDLMLVPEQTKLLSP